MRPKRLASIAPGFGGCHSRRTIFWLVAAQSPAGAGNLLLRRWRVRWDQRGRLFKLAVVRIQGWEARRTAAGRLAAPFCAAARVGYPPYTTINQARPSCWVLITRACAASCWLAMKRVAAARSDTPNSCNVYTALAGNPTAGGANAGLAVEAMGLMDFAGGFAIATGRGGSFFFAGGGKTGVGCNDGLSAGGRMVRAASAMGCPVAAGVAGVVVSGTGAVAAGATMGARVADVLDAGGSVISRRC